jgi:precorrin-6x reductase
VPERGVLILAGPEEAHRLARGLRINPRVILGRPFTGKAEKFNEQLGTQVPRCSYPSVIECVEQGAEIGVGELRAK